MTEKSVYALIPNKNGFKTFILITLLSMGSLYADHPATEAHYFDTSKFKYLSISDRTFSRLSDFVSALVGFNKAATFFLIDAELDGVSSAEKLRKLNIEH